MKQYKNELRCISKTGNVRVAFQALVLFWAMFSVSALWAQTSTGPASSKSDPNALAVISKALTALGGAGNWQPIGAATATISISRPVGPIETVQLSDDWHLGYLLSRRDSSNASGKTATTITEKVHQFRTAGSGTSQTMPRENDVVALAKVSPGAALELSLSQNGCVFAVVNAKGLSGIGLGTEAGSETVEEDCRDPFFPITAQLTWAFSKASGLPTQVRIPIRDLIHNAVAYETVTFVEFSRKGSVSVPSQVNITLPSGQIERHSIAQWSCASSLPSNTFTTAR